MRWTPASHQLADILTKDDEKPADTYRAWLERRSYGFIEEEQALELRRQAKENRLRRGEERKAAAEAKPPTDRQEEKVLLEEVIIETGDEEAGFWVGS